MLYIKEDTLQRYTLCMQGNVVRSLLSADFSPKLTLLKNSLINTISECQTVWIQIRSNIFFRPDLGPNCLQRLSADDTSRQRLTNTHKW